MSENVQHADQIHKADKGSPIVQFQGPMQTGQVAEDSSVPQDPTSSTTMTTQEAADVSSEYVPEKYMGQVTVNSTILSTSQGPTSLQEIPESADRSLHTDKEVSTGGGFGHAANGSVRNGIQADLAAGKLDIPGYKHNVSAENPTQVSDFLTRISLTPHQSLRYRRPFGPALVLPDKALAFKGQILENIRQWAFLATTVDDDKRRAEVLDRVFEKYREVWFEALRIGYNPDINQGERNHLPHASSEQQAGDRRARTVKPRKKDIPPSAVPIFIPEKFKNGRGQAFPLAPVTAGELEEAGITEEQVRKRADEGDLDRAEELLDDVQNDLDRKVEVQDWQRTVAATHLNPTGRHLLLYSLYVAQLYEMSLDQLRRYLTTFKTPSQIKNGQKNINNAEQDRNIFLALALELNDMDSGSAASSPDNSENKGSSPESDGGDVVMLDPPAKPTLTVAKLLEAIDMVVEEADLNNLYQAFDVSGYPENDLKMTEKAQDDLSSVERSKRALDEILYHSKERFMALQEAEEAKDESGRSHWNNEVEGLEAKIRERKKTLRNLVPLLLRELNNEEDNKKETTLAGGREEGFATINSPLETTLSPDVITQITQPDNAESPIPTSGVKHALLEEDGEANDSPEPPMKKQKLQAETQNYFNGGQNVVETGVEKHSAAGDADANDATAAGTKLTQDRPMEQDQIQARGQQEDQQTSQQDPVQSAAEQPLGKKERYVQTHILPMANQLLSAKGQRLIGLSVTDFKVMKDALRDAGIPVEERNKVTREYNRGVCNDWDLSNEAVEEDSRPDTANKGKSKQERQTLGKSMTPASPAPSPQPQRPSLVVKLGIHRSQGPEFDPAQMSCNTLYHHKGFRFRYTRESTLAERRAADDAIDDFVRSRRQKGGYPRYGMYEAICLPNDPERKTIVHGYWDTKDKQLAEGAGWFYDENKPRPDPAVNDMEDQADDEASGDDGDDGYADGLEVVIPSPPARKPKKKVTFAPIVATTAATAPMTPPTTPARPQKKSAINPKLRTAIRLRVNADSNADDSAGASSSRHNKGKGKAAAATAGGRGKAKVNSGGNGAATGGRARGRPKRANAKRTYAMDDSEGGSDDEWQPGDSD